MAGFRDYGTNRRNFSPGGWKTFQLAVPLWRWFLELTDLNQPFSDFAPPTSSSSYVVIRADASSDQVDMPASTMESSSLSNVAFKSAYRTTCDNCMRSKVRCSKDHPCCHRCLGQGVTCTYSPSRKLKKTVGYRNATQQANSTANGAARFSNIQSSRNQSEHSAAASLHDDCTSTPSVYSSANDQPYPSPWNFFGNDSDEQESLIGMEGITQPTLALAALHEPSQNQILDWATHQSSHSMGTSTGEALFPVSPDPDTGPDYISSLFASSGDDSSSITFDAHRGTSSTSESSSTEDGSGRACCSSIAASVLQSLESPGAPLKPNSQPSSAAQGRLCRNLDTVISTNKAVMEILHRISGCTCSVPGNHVIMISAVLFIVLAWYEACLAACGGASEHVVMKAASGYLDVSEMRRYDADISEVGARTVRPQDSPGTESDDLPQLVHIPPIQVGSLQLGVESRRQVVAQIVLTELAKVTKIIESLTERSYGMSSTILGVGGYQKPEAQLQVSLRAALQTRTEKISQAAERASK